MMTYSRNDATEAADWIRKESQIMPDIPTEELFRKWLDLKRNQTQVDAINWWKGKSPEEQWNIGRNLMHHPDEATTEEITNLYFERTGSKQY